MRAYRRWIAWHDNAAVVQAAQSGDITFADGAPLCVHDFGGPVPFRWCDGAGAVLEQHKARFPEPPSADGWASVPFLLRDRCERQEIHPITTGPMGAAWKDPDGRPIATVETRECDWPPGLAGYADDIGPCVILADDGTFRPVV